MGRTEREEGGRDGGDGKTKPLFLAATGKGTGTGTDGELSGPILFRVGVETDGGFDLYWF